MRRVSCLDPLLEPLPLYAPLPSPTHLHRREAAVANQCVGLRTGDSSTATSSMVKNLLMPEHYDARAAVLGVIHRFLLVHRSQRGLFSRGSALSAASF